MNPRLTTIIWMLLVLGACAEGERPAVDLNQDAERFVRLALALGEHDGDYVDAYHGPAAWRQAAGETQQPLESIREAARDAASALRASEATDEVMRGRRDHLARQFDALGFRARMLLGESLSFDEESNGLYDAIAPHRDAAYFQGVLDKLDARLPGAGSLPDRLAAFRGDFEIPRANLDAVFRTAIEECKKRTARYIELPTNETFKVEYVTDKAWSGYNWFQGGAYSVIQVNTDLPIRIERAVDLACHEGYPGHHVYNSLLEERLLKARGWMEFSIFPLFSPTGLIAEGSANYGVILAFPGEERVAFETRVLFPLAGLDSAKAVDYYAIKALTDELAYAGNEAARQYLDGEIDAAAAAAWLIRYTLSEPERAEQRVRFFDKYRSYVINYNLGKDLVAAFVERDAADADARWARFEQLLSNPYLPSQLSAAP